MKDSFEVDNGLIFALYPHLKEHIPEAHSSSDVKALPWIFPAPLRA
jgi:hypothetical protein